MAFWNGKVYYTHQEKNQNVYEVNIENAKPERTFSHGSTSGSKVHVDGDTLYATNDKSDTVTLFDLKNGKQIINFKQPKSLYVSSMAASGQFLYLGNGSECACMDVKVF